MNDSNHISVQLLRMTSRRCVTIEHLCRITLEINRSKYSYVRGLRVTLSEYVSSDIRKESH